MGSMGDLATLTWIDAVDHLPPGGTLVFQDVAWDDYERLLDELGDRPGRRVSYDEGRLEIMAPLAKHEADAGMVRDFVRALTEHLGWEMQSGRCMTIRRRKKAKGLEPDECFWIQNASRVIGKEEFDFETDPPPDIAVEVDVTSQSRSKLPIYAGLGIPELWRFGKMRLEFHHLDEGRYAPAERSRTFPFLPPEALVSFLERARHIGQQQALREFREWVRTHVPR